MKGIFLFVSLLVGPTLFGQMSNKDVHYSFRVTEITDEASAKNLTMELRDYFDKVPSFNDDLNLFKVTTRILISRSEFEERMTAKGLHVELFEQEVGISNTETKY